MTDSPRSSLLNGSRSRFGLGRWRWLGVLAILLLWPNALVPGPGLSVGQTPQAQVQTDHAPAEAPTHQIPAAQEADQSEEGSSGGGHSDPVAPLLAGIVIVLLTARVAGHFFERMGQPAVLGELVLGIVLGNLVLIGFDGLEFLKVEYPHGHAFSIANPQELAGFSMDMLARIGVILLLFQVGLETSVTEMRRVGASAFLVAVVGVIAPMGLGWLTGIYLLPDAHWTIPMFLGATLAATSVGITARVLKDLNKATTKEAQIILGAAVIDDVLGLIVLALVAGIIGTLNSGQDFSAMMLLVIVGKASIFLIGSLVLGQYLSRGLFSVASNLRGKGLLAITALAFCFALAWAANAMGLAPIVGAFAAGLILDKVAYRDLVEKRGEHELEELVRPIADLMVPIFFVMMGMKVNLMDFADPSVFLLAGTLTVAAIIGKQVCALGVIQKGIDRRSIGLGMIPRGEVGLIFAAIGATLFIKGEPVIGGTTYTAVVIMVMFTTMVTPPLLSWSMAAYDKKHGRSTSG